jgi:hypothetical protein
MKGIKKKNNSKKIQIASRDFIFLKLQWKIHSKGSYEHKEFLKNINILIVKYNLLI